VTGATLRNLGIVAHINAGKTTLSERILFATGRRAVMGEVDEGTAALDSLPEEQRRGISIAAAGALMNWRGHRIQLIDTPGHVDFTAEVERSLWALDGLVFVLDGVKGVESQTRTLWRKADEARMPRLLFVNKLDRATADYDRCLKAAQQELGAKTLTVALPHELSTPAAALLDLIGARVRPCGSQAVAAPDRLAAARDRLVEECAELDDRVLRDFLDGGPPDQRVLVAAIRTACLERRLVPVLGGSALCNWGVDLLLDSVCRFLPSPLDVRVVVEDASGSRGEVAPSVGSPLLAQVFRSVHEGEQRLPLCRIYSGTLMPGQRVRRELDPDPILVDRIWRIEMDGTEAVDRAEPGDIVGVECATRLLTGDTLHDGTTLRIPRQRFPEPVVSAVLIPERVEHHEPLLALLEELVEDDPTLRHGIDPETGAILVGGLGELHLEICVERLTTRLRAPVRLGTPRVEARESVRRRGQATAECHLPGGASAVVELAIGPLPGTGPARVEDLTGCPPELATVLAPALRQMTRHGPVLGLAIEDATIQLLVAKCTGDPEGSQTAALEALAVAARKAAASAEPILLEPVVQFEVATPPDTLSAVLSDLKSRDASIGEVLGGEAEAMVRGTSRLEAMLGYPTRLRSITRGLGRCAMLPAGRVARSIDQTEGPAPKGRSQP
jgi:elongation factor G